MNGEKQLLTHSRKQSFKVCRKADWFRYELKIRPTVDAKALRMGSAYHAGLEVLALGGTIDMACQEAREAYSECPEGYEQLWWDYERETVECLLCGYQWRWANEQLEHLAPEKSFTIPLVNPETGKQSINWQDAGKIDGIVKLQDGRLAVRECKLLGDDISMDSDLWRRMRIDPQVSQYIHGARSIGFEVDTVLYDVTRKPTIEPTKVPICDELGCYIVLDANGERVKTKTGTWRTTSDKERGYVRQEREMTPQEWGEKLTNDIVERHDFYYARVEVPRLDADILTYRQESWEIAKTIRDAQLNDRWFRTVSPHTCKFCPYFALCSTGDFDPNGVLPEGLTRVTEVHQELELSDVDSRTPCATAG